MHKPIKVLDFGYVRLIETWGHGDAGDQDHECGIIEAARMSTQGSFRGWDQDAKLLRYLHTHQHNSPFEFAGMTVEVQAPIFVLREWMRHRTQVFNEASARYSPLPDVNYVPTVERLMMRDERNKQAGTAAGAAELTSNMAHLFVQGVRDAYALAESRYQRALSMGVPKEVARILLPVGRYSRMRASANLRNWLAFHALRAAADAQWEIRMYADAVGSILAEQFPRTWALYREVKA